MPKNSAVPLDPAPIATADVDKFEPLLNITSPPSIDTITFFSKRFPMYSIVCQVHLVFLQ